MQKLLSVIIPIYNVEPYLDRCITSIINQTYENLEIIMVDDGSPDKCPEKCDNWAREDTRIKVIHKKNGGLSDARNKGIDFANGDYIAFVDSDDFIENNMYAILVDALERTDAGIATCGRFSFINGNKHECHLSNKELVLSSINAIDELLRGGLIEEAAWDKVYKRELFEMIRFPVGEINEDMPIMPYLIERANRIVCTGIPLYYYCENPGSITHSHYNETKSVVIKHITDVIEYLDPKYPELNDALKEFKGRYSLNMILHFAQDPKLKKIYEQDYMYYKRGVIQNGVALLKSKYVSKKQKVKLLCVLLGIYHPIWKLKKVFYDPLTIYSRYSKS